MWQTLSIRGWSGLVISNKASLLQDVVSYCLASRVVPDSIRVNQKQFSKAIYHTIMLLPEESLLAMASLDTDFYDFSELFLNKMVKHLNYM